MLHIVQSHHKILLKSPNAQIAYFVFLVGIFYTICLNNFKILLAIFCACISPTNFAITNAIFS